MWNVNPAMLCRRHILGEHVEIHMFVGSIRKGISMRGYLDGMLTPATLHQRHDHLVDEMLRRGYEHHSPLPPFTWDGPPGYVNQLESMRELLRRCPECMNRLTGGLVRPI